MAYNPTDHPRAPKGTPQGGQFTQKAGVGVDDDLNEPAVAKPSVPDNILTLSFLLNTHAESTFTGATGEHLTFENGVQMFIPDCDRSYCGVYYDGDTRITLPRREDLESQKAWKTIARWANFPDRMTPGALSQLDELNMIDAWEIAQNQEQLISNDIDNQIDQQYSYDAAPLSNDEYEKLEQYRHYLQARIEHDVLHTNILQFRKQVRKKIQHDLEARRYLD